MQCVSCALYCQQNSLIWKVDDQFGQRRVGDHLDNHLDILDGHLLAVPDIPTTINRTRVEVAVKQVISGKDVTPSAASQNSNSLGYFKRVREIEREPFDSGEL